MTLESITPHSTIDLCGLRCPHLLISVIQALQKIEPKHILQIKATDLNAPSSITSWARQSGNTLLDMYQEGECFVFQLRRDALEFSGPTVKTADYKVSHLGLDE